MLAASNARDMPVEVIAGDSMSKWERYGIPAAISLVVALVLAIED